MVDLRRGSSDFDDRRQCRIRSERLVGHHRRDGQGSVQRRSARRDRHGDQSSTAGRATRSSVRHGRKLQVRRPAGWHLSPEGRASRILDVGSRRAAPDGRLQRAHRCHPEARCDGRVGHRQWSESGCRRHEHDRQRRIHQGSSRFDSARPRLAKRVCHGARGHAGGCGRRRQHDGAAPEPVQLRRVVPAEAPG